MRPCWRRVFGHDGPSRTTLVARWASRGQFCEKEPIATLGCPAAWRPGFFGSGSGITLDSAHTLPISRGTDDDRPDWTAPEPANRLALPGFRCWDRAAGGVRRAD